MFDSPHQKSFLAGRPWWPVFLEEWQAREGVIVMGFRILCPQAAFVLGNY
jgi:hypothetical protein